MNKNITIIILLISLSLVFSCNEVVNKIIVDEKTGHPMLIGRTELSAFQQPDFSEWYNNEYFGYEPDEFFVEQIKSHIDSISIDIFMGTWCSDSRREVPRFIKILDELEFDQNNLRIISVDREKHSPGKNEKNRNIEYVPTFIIYKSNKELGRIVEYPIITLESDLLNILIGLKLDE